MSGPDLDTRTDISAPGVLLSELLTGRTPHGTTFTAAAEAVDGFLPRGAGRA